MKTVYKYPLPFEILSKVLMPYDAKVVCVQEIGDKLFLYAEVGKHDAPCDERVFCVLPTGCLFPCIDPEKYFHYLNTNQVYDGHGSFLIFHIYEIRNQ